MSALPTSGALGNSSSPHHATCRERLDALGPVLAQLGHRRVNISWAPEIGYHVDGRSADDHYFFGVGDTPSEALIRADRHLEREREGSRQGGVVIYV